MRFGGALGMTAPNYWQPPCILLLKPVREPNFNSRNALLALFFPDCFGHFKQLLLQLSRFESLFIK